MDAADRDRLHGELVESMLHAPDLIACGQRLRDDRFVTVISHVERWSWRTVICGSRASTQGIGSIGRGRDRHDWFNGWRLSDDLGNVYPFIGGGDRGDGFCTDFHVRFDGAIAVAATLLVIGMPSGQQIDVVI